MKSLRMGALVAVSALVFACGSSEDSAVPTLTGAPTPPAPITAAPAPSATPTAPAAPSTAPAATPPSNAASNEGQSDDLPIATAPAAAETSNGAGEADDDETDAPATPPEATEGTPEPTTETPPVTPGEPAELAPITIWLAGDSTVATGNTPCPRGWGAEFIQHFKQELVKVNNAAVGGRSVHTWLYNVQTVMDATGECALARDANGEPTLQPRWQTMLDGMKEGDYLFVQFGINDSSATCDRHVGLGAFATAYGMMAQAAKDRGANPIFLTPVSSISCNGTTARGSRGGFVPATINAGQEFDVPVIDLHQRSVELFQERGFCPVAGGDVSAATTGPVGDFFCDDHTHFSPTGAVEIANVVAQALVDQKIPLAAYLR